MLYRRRETVNALRWPTKERPMWLAEHVIDPESTEGLWQLKPGRVSISSDGELVIGKDFGLDYAQDGDWVVKDAKGLRVMSGAAFSETYEPIESYTTPDIYGGMC
jgi:hypothetical protein